MKYHFRLLSERIYEVPFSFTVGLKTIVRVLKPIFSVLLENWKRKYMESRTMKVYNLYLVRHFDRKSNENTIKTTALSDLQY